MSDARNIASQVPVRVKRILDAVARTVSRPACFRRTAAPLSSVIIARLAAVGRRDCPKDRFAPPISLCRSFVTRRRVGTVRGRAVS